MTAHCSRAHTKLLRLGVRLQAKLVTALFATLWLGCESPPRVRTVFDHRIDFTRYRTFAMSHPNRPVPSAGGLDPFTLHRIRQMTFAVLKQHGVTPAPYAEAQLYVSVFGEPQVRTEVIPASTWAPYPHSYYYGSDVRTFDTVTIEVDIVDASQGAVIWYGKAETITDGTASDEVLWPLVEAVLEGFPPSRVPPE